MKKTIIILTSVSLFLFFSLGVAAEKSTSNIIPDMYSSLPSDIQSSLPQSSSESGNGTGISDVITASYIADTFTSMLGGAAKSSVKSLLVIGCLIVLSSVVNAVCETAGESVKRAGEFVCGSAMLISLFEYLKPLGELLSSSLTGIGTIIKASLPAMTAICAASGNVTSSAVNSTWLTALLTLTEQLADSIVSPLISVCFGLLAVTAISHFTDAPDLSGCLDTVKNTVTVLLSVFGTVLTVVMAYQSVIAKGNDGMLLRSVKFASGNFIPVVGGALSEAAANYLNGLSVIKSSAGLIATFSLILYVLPIILRLALSRMGLDAVSILASALGCGKQADIIKKSRSILDLCLALTALCSAIFIIAIAVFAKTAVNI